MALKGNLTDLPIGNIFQMIFMEKKGGKLTVRSGENRVEIFFERGSILHAEQGRDIDSYRLMRVLVANRYLEKRQWQEILEKSRETLQSLWVVVEDIIKTDAYHFIVRRQVEHVLFSLLQWHEGDYEFDAENPVYLDRRLFSPIDGEILLIEVYSAIDEWKGMSSLLPSNSALLSKNEDIIASSYELDKNEEYVLSIIDAPLTFGDIIESSRLGISETGKIVKELIDTTILFEEEEFLNCSERGKPFFAPGAFKKTIPLIIILGTFATAVIVRNSFPGNKPVTANSLKERSELLSTDYKLRNINRAVIYFFSIHGKLPESIYSLVEKKYLARKEVLDQWSRNIVFKKSEDSYSLFSQGRDPEDPTDNIQAKLNENIYR